MDSKVETGSSLTAGKNISACEANALSDCAIAAA